MLSYFSSSVDRELYAIIKDEAYRLNITVKQHVSDIVTEYAKKRKEAEAERDITTQLDRG